MNPGLTPAADADLFIYKATERPLELLNAGLCSQACAYRAVNQPKLFGLTRKRGSEVFVGNLHDLLFELRIGNQFVELLLVSGTVQRHLNCLIDEAGIEQDVGEFDGMDAFFARGNQRRAVDDGIDEVLHQHGVLCWIIRDGDFDFPDVGFLEAEFGFFGLLDHRDFVAGEEELVVFEDDFAHRPDDLETVAAGRFAGRRNENTGRAIFQFHVAGDIVLDFDVMKAAKLDEAADACGHAEEPLQHIELVQALIDKHAATFTLPGRAPTAAGVVGFRAEPIGDNPGKPGDVAKLPFGDELFDLGVTRFGAQLEHAAEDELRMFFGDGNEAFGVGFVGRDGFLHHRVQAVFESGDAERRVLIMRRGDNDSVELAGFQELVRVAESLAAALFVLRKFVGESVANRSQFAARDFAGEKIFGMVRADIAETNDSKTNGIHKIRKLKVRR